MSIVLELLGLLLVAAFAWFVWQPLPLLVVGAALLAASYVRERRGGDRQ
ncbi:MAG TPA: hypothetical protein VIR15_07710 [Intrasporangium sp.]